MIKRVLLFFLLLTSCHRVTPPPHIPPKRRVKIFNKSIKVRVKVLTFQKTLKFGIKGRFRLQNGTRLSTGYYEIKLKHPKKARFLYYRIISKSDHRFQNVPPDLFQIDVGAIIRLNRVTIDNREFYLLKGPFLKEGETPEKVYREPYIPQTGIFELLDKNGRKIFSRRDSIVLFPDSGYFFIHDHDSISGRIILTLNTGAEGVVVLEENIENYIKHVLPAEMPPGFPFEALKAQAVVARTFTLSHIGKSFRYQPYDFVGSVISQAFSTKRMETSDSAVEATSGMVLFYNRKIAEVFYHSTCGGHTENVTYVWDTPEIPYLKGVKDGNFDLDLKDPVEVRLFLKYPPDSLLCKEVENPIIKRYIKRNFRWKVEFTRKEIEGMVKRFTNEKIGKLKAIIPLTRGVSGRITEIMISGSKKTTVIRGEYNIRRLFGGLKSSLFYVDYERNSRGDIEKIILIGGGSGHGVGMCQVGAGILAEKGFKMKDILLHYFPGVKGVKVY